jgi:hypothetical protein
MAFIEQTDLERYIDPDDLEQIIDDDSTVVPGAIEDGEEFVKEKLRQRYDVDAEMAKSAPNRHRQLLKQTIAVVLFYISERLPTDVMPESRGQAYERAVDWLNECASGKRMASMETIDDENQVGLSIRYGKSSTTNNNHY